MGHGPVVEILHFTPCSHGAKCSGSFANPQDVALIRRTDWRYISLVPPCRIVENYCIEIIHGYIMFHLCVISFTLPNGAAGLFENIFSKTNSWIAQYFFFLAIQFEIKRNNEYRNFCHHRSHHSKRESFSMACDVLLVFSPILLRQPRRDGMNPTAESSMVFWYFYCL